MFHTYICVLCTCEDAETLTCRICVDSFVETWFSLGQNNPGDLFKQSLESKYNIFELAVVGQALQ